MNVLASRVLKLLCTKIDDCLMKFKKYSGSSGLVKIHNNPRRKSRLWWILLIICGHCYFATER